MVRWCYRVLSLTLVCALLVVVGAVAAQDQPSGKISLYATSVAAGVGAQWGNGTLTLNNGKQYQFAVTGLEVGGVGFAGSVLKVEMATFTPPVQTHIGAQTSQ